MSGTEIKSRLIPKGGVGVSVEQYAIDPKCPGEYIKGGQVKISTADLLDAEVVSTEAYRSLKTKVYRLCIVTLKLKSGRIIRIDSGAGYLALDEFEGYIGDVSIPD